MKTNLSHREQAREALYLKLMIKSLLIVLLALCTSFSAEADSTLVKLSLSDNTNNEALPFANVAVYQNGVKIAMATTDMDGRCEFKNLVPGKYDFKAVYIGYMAQEIKRVDVFSEKTNWLNIKMKGGSVMVTCCCSCYCYEDRTENWWPKLWTPYREMYNEWKEKKERKLAKQVKKNEIKLSEEPDEHGIADSIEIARIELVEKMAKEIKIYPNPASDVLHIETNQTLQDLIIRDESGKVVREEVMRSSATDINLQVFSSGIYYLHYLVNGKNESKKIVVIAP